MDVVWPADWLGDGDQELSRIFAQWREGLQENMAVVRDPDRSLLMVLLQVEVFDPACVSCCHSGCLQLGM